MRFLALPVRNLVRRPIRSGLTVMGIAIALAAMVALVGLSQGLERAWSNGLMERGTHVLVTPRDSVEILTASLDEKLVESLAAAPGVAAAAGELMNLVNVGQSSLLVVGWRPGGFLWEELALASGGPPGEGDGDRVVIGSSLARRLGVGPGDGLDIMGRPMTVSGVARPSGVMTGATMTMPLAALQSLLERPNQVTVINLRLDDPADPEAVREVLARLTGDYPRLSFAETDKVADNDRILKMLRVTAWAISGVALAMGIFAVLNTLLMSVFERTWEIGVLSAVGWSARRVVALVVLEGLIMAAVGGLAGVALGLLGLNWLAGLEAVHGFIEPRVTFHFLVQVFLASLVLGGLGGLYPAVWAARLRSVDALRHA